MAYITAEEIKAIRVKVKAAYPAKDGWKFSITGKHHSSVTVAIMQSPAEYTGFQGYQQLNHYYLDQANISDKELKVLETIKDILTEKHWDNSEPQVDYFDVAYYYYIHIGKWNRDAVLAAPKAPVKRVKAEKVVAPIVDQFADSMAFLLAA